ncbi:MAG: restriction endonuclease subunit S, partial [Burkholderiaceae bacterium]|nr:restriction endonuclease subunit S [Burkholderiaceae bacterium]
MSSDVSWVKLDDVIEDIVDRRGVTPLKLGGDFTSQGHRVISAKLIKDGRVMLDADEARFVDAALYKKWMKTPLCSGDVLMTSEAPLGELAYLHSDVDWVLGQRLFAIRPRKGILDGRFLYYVLRNDQVRSDILGRATGTTVQGIRQAELRLVKIPVPDLNEQKIIAEILGSIDDRITLLRETNATLEAIAQALFKSWFVDFDPVHAKAAGREPEGMDKATAALFPDGFEESELGLVPRGWREATVGEIAEVVKGKSYSSKELVNSHNTALVTLKSFERGGGFRLDGFKPYLGNYKMNQVVLPGDLIVAYTDVTQAAELIGKPAIVVGVDEYETLVASLDVGIVRPDENKVSRQF